MKYTEKSFTLPAASETTSQKNWDRAFLTADEFLRKYGPDPEPKQ